MTAEPYSVVVPSRGFDRLAADSLSSIETSHHSSLREVLFVVDPRVNDLSHERRIRQMPKVRVLAPTLEEPSVGALLNFGISSCSTDLVFRHDADDLWVAGREALQLAELKQQVSVVAGRAALLRGPRVRRDLAPPIPAGLLWSGGLLLGNPLVHPTVAMRLSHLPRGHLNDVYDASAVAEDYLLWLRLALASVPITVVPSVVTLYRRHPAQESNFLSVESAAPQLRPSIECVASSLGISSAPPIAITICRGSCGHDASDISSYFRACGRMFAELQRLHPIEFKRHEAFLTGRAWLVAFRHRRELRSVGLLEIRRIVAELPVSSRAGLAVAMQVLRSPKQFEALTHPW